MHSDSTISKFWRKINRVGENDCWIWLRGTSRNYGGFSLAGKYVSAHRFAWEITNGPIPSGLDVLHRCDNPPCCNPAHLFLGTQADNNRDMVRKGRHVSLSGDQHYSRIHPEKLARGLKNGMNTHPEKRLRGEKNGNSKLTQTQVREIRELNERKVHKTLIAAQFNINLSTVYRIINGDLW